jgi:hypothetical protein
MRSGRISHPDGSLDCDTLAGRIAALHGEVEDEDSRVELIRLHDALMSSSVQRLIEQGRDPGPLTEAWRRGHLSFLLAESLTGGEVDQEKLARVNAREIAAGRLRPDEAVQIRKAESARPANAGAVAEPARLNGENRVPEEQLGGLLGSARRGLGRLFRKGDPVPAAVAAVPAPASEEPPPASDEPEPASIGETQSALERAYRAISLWQEERMQPRIDGLVEEFRYNVEGQGLEPGDALNAAADAETLRIGGWFQENEESFLREAVSYLDDEIIRGLREMGVDRQFHQVMFDAVHEAREELKRRIWEIREGGVTKSPLIR